MLDSALPGTLKRLTAAEQKAGLTVAEYIESQRASGEKGAAAAIVAEFADPLFTDSEENLSPARRAARQFMRENRDLMQLLAQ
jgi:hypothetical protein